MIFRFWRKCVVGTTESRRPDRAQPRPKALRFKPMLEFFKIADTLAPGVRHLAHIASVGALFAGLG